MAEEEKGAVQLDQDTEGIVGPALLELRALGDAIAAIGIAGPMASLDKGTLINLGYLIIEKVETVGVALGIMGPDEPEALDRREGD